MINFTLASSSLSSSTNEEPTFKPRAFKKVKTIPPPMINLSTLLRRDSMTTILVETLEPPTMAAKGLVGLATAPYKEKDQQ